MFEQKRSIPYFDDHSDVDEDRFSRPKKTRTEELISRVLHIRFLPLDADEREVARLASPFGTIHSILYTKNGQAFIEFHYLECATNMLNYYNTFNPPVIRGQQQIGMQYSKYLQLDLLEGPETLDNIAAANQLHEEIASYADQRRRVLMVQVLQALSYPVGYIFFYQALHKFGKIRRIVTFKSGSYPQAFVEFADPISVDVARTQFDGATLVSGVQCRVNYCRQSTLEIHQESQFCRDFIRNPLTSDEIIFSPMGDNKHGALPSVKELSSMDPISLCDFANDVIQAMVFVAGGSRGPESQSMKNQIATINHLTPLVRSAPIVSTSGTGPAANKMTTLIMDPGTTPVILVGQLNVERITPDILFTLFGVYGDVQRVKILYNRKDIAMVQFTDANQANLALQYLNGVSLFGNPLRITHSKYTTIKSPFGQTEGGSAAECTDLNRDYTGSLSHRYRNAKSRNFLHICAPNSVLHITSLPTSITENDLISAIAEKTDHPIVNLKILSQSSGSNLASTTSEIRIEKKMALVEFANISDAVEALIAFDGHEIVPGSRVRVSFSKYAIQN